MKTAAFMINLRIWKLKKLILAEKFQFLRKINYHNLDCFAFTYAKEEEKDADEFEVR